MGFTVYKHPEKKNLTKKNSSEWHWNMYYYDNCKGGKRREKEFAKVCEEDGCKVVWDKVK